MNIFDTHVFNLYTKPMRSFKLTITHLRILDTVNELNQNGFYPSNEGIFKILTGKKDDESLKFKDYKNYSTLISYSSKRICSLSLVLFRHNYLEKKYDPKTNELYFKITKTGEQALNDYFKGKDSNYLKKEIVEKPSIVRID